MSRVSALEYRLLPFAVSIVTNSLFSYRDRTAAGNTLLSFFNSIITFISQEEHLDFVKKDLAIPLLISQKQTSNSRYFDHST